MARARRAAEPRWTPAEVARRFGVRVNTVYEWLRKGVIGYEIIGPRGEKKIPASEAERVCRPREWHRKVIPQSQVERLGRTVPGAPD